MLDRPPDPPAKPEPPPTQQPAQQKRKSSKTKKVLGGRAAEDGNTTDRTDQRVDESPVATASTSRRSKRPSRKSEDVDPNEDDVPLKKDGPKSGLRKATRSFSDEEKDGPARTHNGGDHDDDAAMEERFRSTFLGRGHPSGLSSMASTMRALSGMMSGSGTSSRLREILESLRQKDDPSRQLVALNELSNLLLISTEDNLSGHFAPDQFVRELVALMQPNEFGEDNPEMMLVACRCIANLMEALPPATASVVYGGAVPVLCQKLLEIQYIDVAEQALSTLEKISQEFPASIVREGGLTACLTYLDFFATSTQRTAVTTAANCCRNIPDDSFPVVRDVMPILLNVLSSSDQRVVEQGSLCVSRVVESFKYHAAKLEELVSPDLLRAILRLLLPGTTNLIGPNIHTQFLRVLAITARSSPSLSTELFKMDVIDTLYQILTGVSPPDDLDDVASKIDGVVIMQALIHRPREQIFETLNVICELLPGVSTAHLGGDTVPPAVFMGEDCLVRSTYKTKNESNEKRIELLAGCQDKVKRFATILLPTLTHAFSSTVNLSVRQKVLSAQLKMLSNLNTDILESALRTVPFSSYLSSILSQQDHPTLVWHAILAAELLLTRLEHIYGYQFYREGVMAEVQKLAERPVEKPETKESTQHRRSGSDLSIAAESSKGLGLGPNHRNSASEGEESADDGDEDDPEIEEDDEDDEDHDADDDDEVDDEELGAEIRDDPSPSPSSSSSDRNYPLPDPAKSLDNFVTLQAKRLYEMLQRNQFQEGRNKANHISQSIKSLAAKIRDNYSEPSPQDGVALFKELSEYFSDNTLESMTSAELLNSDIVDVLLDVFDDSKGLSSAAARNAFLRVFMKSGTQNSVLNPFGVLVQKLQDLLSRAEHFEVVTVHQNTFDNGRSSASTMLAKQLRLKLVADDDSEIPKPYRNIMVSIHAIATFRALDDYLRPRLSLSDRPRGGRHHEGLSGSLAALAAATGVPSPHQRFLERGLFGLADSPSHPPPPPAAPGLPATPRQDLRKTNEERPVTPSSHTAAQTPPVEGKPAPRRSRRRSAAKAEEPKAEEPKAEEPKDEEAPAESKDALECADERQLTDEDDDEDENALDAFVDDMEDDIDSPHAKDSPAVNMEVASTGRVTARQEDGTRVPTPSQNTGYAAPPRQRSQQSTPSSAAQRSMSYAAAIQAAPTDWHIEFSIDGQPIPSYTTIYRAVHYNKEQPNEMSVRNVWSAIHPVKFKKVPGPAPQHQTPLGPRAEQSERKDTDLPASIHKHLATSKILRLLNTLHGINANLLEVLDPAILQFDIRPETAGQFVNTKLTAKLNRQLEEPLIVASNCLPAWSEDLARLYPFLFPFETRHLFLQSTSFGYARSMSRWQSSTPNNDSQRHRHDDRPFLGRLQRQKVRISRTRILESAIKVLELYGASPSVLEVEYFEEVGTGLGPTLEFYSSVSKEFSKKKTKLWRDHESNTGDEFAFGKQGLFPAPMSNEQAATDSGKKILHLFKMLGKFVARAMLDSRIIDVSFNPMFFKLGAQSSDAAQSLNAIKFIDPDLASSLRLVKQYATVKKEIGENDQLSMQEKASAIRGVEINHVKLEDLALDFTLPGYPAIELIDNGSNIPVTMANVERYVDTVVDLTLGHGVQRQMDSFRGGFSEVFPYRALKAFTPGELVMLFGRIEEDWTLESKSSCSISHNMLTPSSAA
jgi:E3 ubiquitin-protein ligase TRIP12